MKKLIAGLLGAGFMLSVAPAMAGEWRLDTRQCQDLREDGYDRWDSRYNHSGDRYDRWEDRQDSRYDYGRRDRLEDRADRRDNRRDESVIVCPRSAWVYFPDRREIARGYDRDRNGYYKRDRNGQYNRNSRYRAPEISFSFDSRRDMSYRVEGDRRVYVRDHD